MIPDIIFRFDLMDEVLPKSYPLGEVESRILQWANFMLLMEGR